MKVIQHFFWQSAQRARRVHFLNKKHNRTQEAQVFINSKIWKTAQKYSKTVRTTKEHIVARCGTDNQYQSTPRQPYRGNAVQQFFWTVYVLHREERTTSSQASVSVYQDNSSKTLQIHWCIASTKTYLLSFATFLPELRSFNERSTNKQINKTRH